jgi:hypothetical protein
MRKVLDVLFVLCDTIAEVLEVLMQTAETFQLCGLFFAFFLSFHQPLFRR